MTENNPRVSRIIIVLWACFLTLPFVRQPLHLDDCFYYDIAKNVPLKPLFPQDMPYVFESGHTRDLASNSHAPFVSYYIALAKATLPDRLGEETRFHLVFALFPVIIGLASYSLARAFSPYPLLVALLIQATPAVMVNSHTLMSDVPALAFWLSSLAGFRLWVSRQKKRYLILCMLTAMLAAFAAYQALSLVLLFALYGWLKGKMDRGVVLACAVPILFITGWYALGFIHYGRFPFMNTAAYAVGRGIFSPYQVAERIVAILAYIGGTTLFPLGLLLIWAGWLQGRVLTIALLVSAAIVQAFASNYTLGDKALLALLLSAALIVSARILSSGILGFVRKDNEAGSSESVFLAAWFGFVLLYCIVIFFTSTARYILPLIPPLVIFVTREVHRLISARRFTLVVLLAATTVQAAAMSIADFQFAGIYPQMANQMQFAFGQLPGRIWYGGEWGFRHYMDQAGFKLISSDLGSPPVRGGDLLLLPELASPYGISKDLESMLVKVGRCDYKPDWPIRLLDNGSHAGFHSVHWGLLPFSFSSSTLETLKVYQVSILSEKLPDALPSNQGTSLPYPAFVERNGERKLALVGDIPMHITYKTALPRNGIMTFGIAALKRNMRDSLPQPVVFSVRLNNGKGESIPLFSHTVASAEPDRRFTLDIMNIPDGDVDLEFESTAQGTLETGARAAWIDFYVLPRPQALDR
jgi:hypothetical protein